MSTLTKNPYTFWRDVKSAPTGDKVNVGLILLIIMLVSGFLWYSWWTGMLPLGLTWDLPLKFQGVLIGVAFFAPPFLVGGSSSPKKSTVGREESTDDKDRGEWIEEYNPSPGFVTFVKALFSTKKYKLQWQSFGGRYLLGLGVLGIVLALWWTQYLTPQALFDQYIASKGILTAVFYTLVVHLVSLVSAAFCISLPVQDKSHWEADGSEFDEMPSSLSRYSPQDRRAWHETMNRKRQDELDETAAQLFQPKAQAKDEEDKDGENVEPEGSSDDMFGSFVRFSNWLRDRLGGQDNYNAAVTTFMVVVLAFILVNVIGAWVSLVPALAIGFFILKGWNKRKKVVNIPLAAAGLVVSLVLGVLIFGTQMAVKSFDPMTILASSSLENNMGGGNQNLLTTFANWVSGLGGNDSESEPVPTATAVPIDVVPFDPEHTLKDFDPRFTEGAVAEITQVVGYLNGSISLVKEVETNRASAPAEEGTVLALNTTLLLSGIPGETGIAESQGIVASWCTTGVQRQDGTYEATTYEERVRAEQEKLEEEGANVNALVTAGYKLCETYDEFVQMLKALEMDAEDNVRDPDGAQQHLQRFLELRAELNGTLTQLFGVETTIEDFDSNFVTNFMGVANSKGQTIVATATPYNPGPSAPVASLVPPTTPPQPTETALPTDTPVPPPTSTPMPVGCQRQGANGLVSHGLSGDNSVRPYADASYLPFNVSFTFTVVEPICGYNWVTLENGQTWAIIDMFGLQPGQTYWKYAIGQGNNVTEWGFQSPDGAKNVIYQMPATPASLPTTPSLSGCTELATSNDPMLVELRSRLHFLDASVDNGEIVIVPHVTLFDVAFIWPTEGTPFSIQAVSAACGKNWIYAGNEIWAYDNILGLRTGVTYFRELIRENDTVVGVRFIDGAGNVGYEWVQP